jgi:hypothetical protein
MAMKTHFPSFTGGLCGRKVPLDSCSTDPAQVTCAVCLTTRDRLIARAKDPQHLPRCYEAETGSKAFPEVFWVCSSRCPVLSIKRLARAAGRNADGS